MAIFWEKGFADTSLQDLEKATGVNRSGLYSEFRDKEDLFLEALRYYLANRGTRVILSQEPFGIVNLRRFLQIGETSMDGQRGCFKINAMRELPILPAEARTLIEVSQRRVHRLLARNIRAAFPGADVTSLTEITMTFFTGLCLEQNLCAGSGATRRKVNRFLGLLRRM